MLGNKKLSDERTVLPDYWYTTTHIEDLGEEWQRNGQEAGEKNLFISCGEKIGRTGFDAEHLDDIPEGEEYKILLPLNKGGYHWTAITVRITRDEEGMEQVKIDFTDSLSLAKNFRELPEFIQDEMRRIGSYFKGSKVNYGVYHYTWQQRDASSCGPYSFANAVRCLDDDRRRENPGREAIRAQQLKVMTNPTGIKSCSTNNQIDEILRNWVFTQISRGEDYSIPDQSSFENMCGQYAKEISASARDITQIFYDEYGAESVRRVASDPESVYQVFRLHRVKQRLNELLATDLGLQESLETINTGRRLSSVREKMQHNNSMEQIEIIRKQFAATDKFGSRKSYQVTAKIIEHLSKMNQEEAFNEILQLEDEKKINKCIEAITAILSSRTVEKDYSEKLSALTEAYHDIYEAKTKLRDAEKKHEKRTSELRKIASKIQSVDPIKANQQTLDKTIRLLECAIRRNNANLVQSVGYFFKDCLAYITRAVTLGWWQPDRKLINKIAETVAADGFNDELSRIRKFLSTQNLVQASEKEVLANEQKVKRSVFHAERVKTESHAMATPRMHSKISRSR